MKGTLLWERYLASKVRARYHQKMRVIRGPKICVLETCVFLLAIATVMVSVYRGLFFDGVEAFLILTSALLIWAPLKRKHKGNKILAQDYLKISMGCKGLLDRGAHTGPSPHLDILTRDFNKAQLFESFLEGPLDPTVFDKAKAEVLAEVESSDN